VAQYVHGFQQIAEVVRRFSCYDVFSMDNTVEDPALIDRRVVAAMDQVPTLTKVHFWDNELGRLNKGSGYIVQWQRTLPELLGRYEFILHGEPRQDIVDHSFFERVSHSPGNYWCLYRDLRVLGGITWRLPRVWIGQFAIRTQDLWNYCSSADRRVPPRATPQPWWWNRYRYLRSRLLPGWWQGLDECIEADFVRFIRLHHVPMTRVANLGTRWHEEVTGKWHDMIDCDRWP